MDSKIKLEWLERLPTHPDVPAHAVGTGVRLAAYADRYGHDAFPGPALLAHETGQSLRTVKEHLARLTAAGVVIKATVGGSSAGKRVATEYRLIDWWTRAADRTGIGPTHAVHRTGTRAAHRTGPVQQTAHHPGSTPALPKQAACEGAVIDDNAAWLADELGADPAACRRAIARKQQQAAERDDPWRNPRRMIRDVIPLDEWRPLVAATGPQPRRKPVISGQCGQPDCAPGKHVHETAEHRTVCWGPPS